jgi:selenocysteine lyase/cysteine desulfurase
MISLCRGSIDVREMDCDFWHSAYKFLAHVGLLYGKPSIWKSRPYKVRPSPGNIPDRWERDAECLRA